MSTLPGETQHPSYRLAEDGENKDILFPMSITLTRTHCLLKSNLSDNLINIRIDS